MKKDFAVIGLGSFGRHLCRELNDQGANVLALDISEERVAMVAEFIPQAFCCDCTQEETLKKLGLTDVNHVILTMKNSAVSILITVLLKELGVKKLTARAEDESMKKIFLRLGADEVINPQELAVNDLCGMLLNNSVKHLFEITDQYSVATLSYTGEKPSQKLLEMDFRNRYHLNVLLIRRAGKDFTPSGDDRFMPGDAVVVFGTNDAIKTMDKQIH